MEGLSVKKLSAKSLAKLKKGHAVRLVKGEGTTLCVSPEKFNHITRSFARGKGLNMCMSPEEVAHNHGKGIFDTLKRGASKLGSIVAPIAEKVAHKALDKATEKGTQYVEKQIEKKFAGEGMPTPTELDNDMKRAVAFARSRKGKATVAGLTSAYNSYMNDGKGLYGGALDTDILNKINDLTGQKLGAFAKSNLVQAGARMLRGNMERAFTHGLHSMNTGHGIYASPSGGEGLHPRHHMEHHKRRMIERCSIGAGGNLLGVPPALMSQPYSANFQFSSRLPPAYANMIKGNGLY